MSFKGLRITGPDARPYVLGEPIDVFDGAMHVGRLLSVSVSPNGNEVRLEDFLTTDLSQMRHKRMALLVMAEIVTYISERYPSVHVIGIVLSRDLEGFEGREAQLASVRSQMLQSIGADSIRVTPRPHAHQAGHFVVSGIWQYTRPNVAALAGVLQAERAAYRKRLAHPEPGPAQRTMLGRLLGRAR